MPTVSHRLFTAALAGYGAARRGGVRLAKPIVIELAQADVAVVDPKGRPASPLLPGREIRFDSRLNA